MFDIMLYVKSLIYGRRTVDQVIVQFNKTIKRLEDVMTAETQRRDDLSDKALALEAKSRNAQAEALRANKIRDKLIEIVE